MKRFMNDINPCGCGGKPVCYETRYYGAVYTVECPECGMQTRPFNSPEEAVAVWNNAMPKRRQRTRKNEDVLQ